MSKLHFHGKSNSYAYQNRVHKNKPDLRLGINDHQMSWFKGYSYKIVIHAYFIIMIVIFLFAHQFNVTKISCLPSLVKEEAAAKGTSITTKRFILSTNFVTYRVLKQMYTCLRRNTIDHTTYFERVL